MKNFTKEAYDSYYLTFLEESAELDEQGQLIYLDPKDGIDFTLSYPDAVDDYDEYDQYIIYTGVYLWEDGSRHSTPEKR